MENGWVEKLIKTPENYYAHLREAEGKVLRETLREHTRLTYKYFMQLWEEKSVQSWTAKILYGTGGQRFLDRTDRR